MKKSNWLRLLTLLLVLAFVMAACSSGTNNSTEPEEETMAENTTAENTTTEEEPMDTAEPTEDMGEMPEVSFAVMPGGALEQAVKGAYAGTTVTVDGAFEGNDADGVKFKESMKAFEEATGITVNYVGSKEFEGSIAIRV
ncbi:MAG: hypothetical protein KC443_24210, partial [Anaerolineales bacterium]|nr:hypothetical protein [Anaerolineales bacterium]